MVSRWLQPEALVWGGRLVRDVALAIAADGTCDAAGVPPPGATVERLPGKLLLPGLVNAHSHAFQRLLRGRTQAPGATGGLRRSNESKPTAAPDQTPSEFVPSTADPVRAVNRNCQTA